MHDARRRTGTRPVLLRVVLVVALVVGLCAMHVLATAVGWHHAEAHDASASTTAVAPAGAHADHHAGPRAETRADVGEHRDHHDALDCVLALGAGVAALVVLVALAARRALRRSYRPAPAWPRSAVAVTPWRGPPPWRWPRTSLCVIRV
ncbi:DUF6153 family protein [Kineococcus gypseus]|uniref:DUF6153 family protein n=1 Tax=Kineococcus gypseus TaxID=1637102 RepID=UPI003D7CEA73